MKSRMCIANVWVAAPSNKILTCFGYFFIHLSAFFETEFLLLRILILVELWLCGVETGRLCLDELRIWGSAQAAGVDCVFPPLLWLILSCAALVPEECSCLLFFYLDLNIKLVQWEEESKIMGVGLNNWQPVSFFLAEIMGSSPKRRYFMRLTESPLFCADQECYLWSMPFAWCASFFVLW